jgi:peroxiredoxin
MKKISSFLPLLVFSIFSFAQTVNIKGVGTYYATKTIRVWTNNDYISNSQKEITYSEIDSAGNFNLEFITKEINYITLKIDKYIASMYVEPNYSYELIVMPPDSTTYHNPNIEHDINIQINLKSRTEINALTMDYDKRFDYFLSIDYPDFVKRTPQAKIDSFKLAITNYYSTVSNPYFKTYIDYSIAAMEQKTNKSEKKLYQAYLENKPLLHHHLEYMNFFNTFYKQKLQTFSKEKDGAALSFNINNKGSYAGTMEVLKKAKYLQNDTIRELVLIKGMYESYYDGSFDKMGIKAILKQIVEQSKIDEHKRIAQNCLSSFSKLQKGSIAPFFELPDKTGITHSLDELRSKKYVYLMFYDQNCLPCMQQMKVIPSLKKTYGAQIEFVAISNDKSNADLKNFTAKYPKYDWTFLYDNSNGNLKKSYEIITLPTYFLISPDGKFIQVPADSPENNIEQVFFELTKPKEKRHGVGNKQNN